MFICNSVSFQTRRLPIPRCPHSTTRWWHSTKRRWRPRVASWTAPRSPWYVDEGTAARPSASPRKPPSVRAITVIPVRILRKNHNKEEDHPLLKPQAGCLTARGTVARLEADSRRVASTHVVQNDDKGNVPGWTTLWVSLSCQCEKDWRVQKIQATSAHDLVTFQMDAGIVRSRRYQFQRLPTWMVTWKLIQVQWNWKCFSLYFFPLSLSMSPGL